MKLSDLKPGTYQVEKAQEGPKPAQLRLSDLDPSEIEIEAEAKPEKPRGQKMYTGPIGPNPEFSLERVGKTVGQALSGVPKGQRTFVPQDSYSLENAPVAGLPPLAAPATMLPKLAQVATKLADSMPGRAVTSYGSGAFQGATSGPEGQTLGERIDRAHGAGMTALKTQGALEAIPYIGKFAKWAGRKGAATLTGIPDDVISTYASKTDDVNQVIKDSGGDISGATDRLRERIAKGLEGKKESLNAAIGKTLSANPGPTNVPIDDVVATLEKSKAGINKNYAPEAISQIDDLIARIKKDSVNGMVNAKGLNDMTQFLQDVAEGAYNKGGQVFIGAKESAKAAKGAGAVSRRLRNQASPELAESYSGLSKMRGLIRNTNRNLLAPGKSDSALLAAGSGQNQRNQKILQLIGDEAGLDALGEAQKLAAARAFASPSWLPVDSTGKIVGRMVLGAGTGYLIDGEKGAAIGGALTSPGMLKAGINLANLASPVVSKVASPLLKGAAMARQNPVATHALLGPILNQAEKNQPIPPEIEQYYREHPELIKDIADPRIRAALQEKLNRVPSGR